MKIAILRNLSLCTRHLLLPPKSEKNSGPLISLFIFSIRSTLRSYSSKSDSSSGANFAQTNRRNSSFDDVDGVSHQELKRRIERFYEGDEDVIPSILEAILKRKLAGFTDDDEILKELRPNSPNEVVKEEYFDSDLDKLHDSESDDENGR